MKKVKKIGLLGIFLALALVFAGCDTGTRIDPDPPGPGPGPGPGPIPRPPTGGGGGGGNGNGGGAPPFVPPLAPTPSTVRIAVAVDPANDTSLSFYDVVGEKWRATAPVQYFVIRYIGPDADTTPRSPGDDFERVPRNVISWGRVTGTGTSRTLTPDADRSPCRYPGTAAEFGYITIILSTTNDLGTVDSITYTGLAYDGTPARGLSFGDVLPGTSIQPDFGQPPAFAELGVYGGAPVLIAADPDQLAAMAGVARAFEMPQNITITLGESFVLPTIDNALFPPALGRVTLDGDAHTLNSGIRIDRNDVTLENVEIVLDEFSNGALGDNNDRFGIFIAGDNVTINDVYVSVYEGTRQRSPGYYYGVVGIGIAGEGTRIIDTTVTAYCMALFAIGQPPVALTGNTFTVTQQLAGRTRPFLFQDIVDVPLGMSFTGNTVRTYLNRIAELLFDRSPPPAHFGTADSETDITSGTEPFVVLARALLTGPGFTFERYPDPGTPAIYGPVVTSYYGGLMERYRDYNGELIVEWLNQSPFQWESIN